MSRLEGSDNAAFYVVGKGFIIVMVIIFSSLGFGLGYYVGKSGRIAGQDPAGRQLESATAPQETFSASEERPAPFETETEPETKFHDDNSGMKGDRVSDEKTDSTLGANSQRREGGEDLIAGGTPKVPSGQTAKREKRHQEGNPSPAGNKVTPHAAELLYTVQMGAFRNEDEADNFMTKYGKKGYKPYITVSKNKRNEKIFRIRAGEFRTRKSAEVFAMKLKKTEGLNTYVTFKNE